MPTETRAPERGVFRVPPEDIVRTGDDLAPTTPEPTHKHVEIRVVVCPHPECNNYYGATSMAPDMTKLFSGPKVENRRAHQIAHGSKESKTLADCPECLLRGRGRIERTPMTLRANVPLLSADYEPTPLPADS